MALSGLRAAFEKIRGFKDVLDLLDTYKQEQSDVNRCLKVVGEKRDKALARRAQFKPGKTYLTSWSEDDRYADDKFYQQKLRECYDKNRPLQRAMGLP